MKIYGQERCRLENTAKGGRCDLQYLLSSPVCKRSIQDTGSSIRKWRQRLRNSLTIHYETQFRSGTPMPDI